MYITSISADVLLLKSSNKVNEDLVFFSWASFADRNQKLFQPFLKFPKDENIFGECITYAGSSSDFNKDVLKDYKTNESLFTLKEA